MAVVLKQRFADPHFQFRIAVAFVLLVTFVHMMALPLIVSYDGMEYVHLANVFSGPSFLSNWNFYRTPLFPLALNGAFRLGGEQPEAALLVTTLFGLGGILVTGWTVRKIAGATTGAITLVLLVFYPILVGYEHMLLSETGIFFWLALLLYSLVCLAPGSGRIAMWVPCWTALVLALGYYWRPTILYLSPVAAVAFLFIVLVPADGSKSYSGLLRQVRRGERRAIAGALIVGLGPWLLAYPWKHLTNKHLPGSYYGFVAVGMFKEVLVPPDDPILAPIRADYKAAIEHDSINGRLPLDGVTIGSHEALISRIIPLFAREGVGRLIRRHPLRYLEGVAKSMVFFLGVPDHQVDDENWNFSHFVFALWPSVESLDRTLGWDAKFVQFAPRPYGGGAFAGRMLDGLMPIYTWVVLGASMASFVWMVVSIKLADPIGFTLTAIPFALLFVHALTLMAADRYGFSGVSADAGKSSSDRCASAKLMLQLSALLSLLTLPSLHFSPRRYRPHGVGNWSGHIPFACDLVASLRPSVFVELGTHLGESYFAFCQAILESGTPAKAYAVDTWEGDVHTGSYGDEVFREVDEYNRELYSGFSRLMRMPFDEAARHFESESIDLLHIDGLHTYEAVRHDFDTWWPKVKPGGMVLLHDSSVRQGDFGVWKLLDEVRQLFPTAEFFHSNGLGVVLKPGTAREGGVVSILFGDDTRKQELRRYYEVCADHLEYRFWWEQQNRPASWDITTQLYWRSEGDRFTESASVHIAHTITPERSRVRLAIPAVSAPLTELRIDLTGSAAFLELHGIAALDREGETLWSLGNPLRIEELTRRGLHGIPTADGSGVLVVDTPAGASFLIAVPLSAREKLQAGGQIVVEMSGLEPWSFASKLAAGSGRREAQLYLEWREEMERYDRVLAQTQALGASRSSEVETMKENLKTAEERVSALQAEIVARERELAEMHQRLSAIESSLLWRAVRPLTGVPKN